MKDKPNEWMSISDLMAGVMGVMMLLFVIAVVSKRTAEQQSAFKKRQEISQILADIRSSIANDGDTLGVVISDSMSMIKLPGDNSFMLGSACLTRSTRSWLESHVAPILSRKLKEHPNVTVQIEGHSDAQNVSRISVNLAEKCALYDDNYTLSAGRAREVRKAILSLSKGDSSIGRRISVVGYGPDRLVNPSDPNASENRRVEIRLINGF